MKIKIINDKGVEVTISPSSVMVNGRTLEYWITEITKLKAELKNFKYENKKLADNLKQTWEEIK